MRRLFAKCATLGQRPGQADHLGGISLIGATQVAGGTVETLEKRLESGERVKTATGRPKVCPSQGLAMKAWEAGIIRSITP